MMTATNTQPEPNSMLIGGANQQQIRMDASMANRHGMIAGATGTGKTVTMQILAEAFSKIGVPVLMADIKGDVSGLACAATPHPKIDERIEKIAITDYQMMANPVVFWDLYGKLGHHVRATVGELGPLMLSNLLDLNETQTGVLYTAFKIADENSMMLYDLEDLQALLTWMSAEGKSLRGEYGNFTTASIGAIQRGLLVLEEQDAEVFVGEPVLDLQDMMRLDFSGRGIINILDVTTIISRGPRMYATFLMWLMSELFENLPEAGDSDKPKFVMFFDEAHLLFDDAPKALVEKIEQVVRLIRSKGVGVYFVSQSPLDIPEDILGQLGLKIQHALRAFTPKERKAVSVVAENFRQNPEIDTKTVITELGIGEALVSVLDSNGAPTEVERVLVRPPQSRIGPATDEERTEQIKRSPIGNKYDETLNRESAKEVLKERAEKKMKEAEELAARDAKEKAEKKSKSGRRSDTATEAMIKSLARSVGTQVGKRIIRGVLGSLLGGR